MTEILFILEEATGGGSVAHAVGAPMVMEADALTRVRAIVRDAGRRHVDEDGERPTLIRLHLVHDEVIAA